MKTILVVDREEQERKLLIEMLEAEGYRVHAAANAMDALAATARAMPDLVVLELALPHANGVELMGKLVTLNRKLPIIIYSVTASYQENFMCWLADAYILKASGFDELKAAVDELLPRNCPVLNPAAAEASSVRPARPPKAAATPAWEFVGAGSQ